MSTDTQVRKNLELALARLKKGSTRLKTADVRSGPLPLLTLAAPGLTGRTASTKRAKIT